MGCGLGTRWWKHRGGNVAILFALMLPVVVGGAGYGVETSYWYFRRLQMQSASDAAAYAGAIVKRAGQDQTTIQAAATTAAGQNGFDSSSGTVTVNSPPATGPNTANDAVEVLLDS